MELAFLQAVFIAFLVNFASGQQAPCSTGDVRLVGGRTNLEGRVEVCSDGAWGTVCDDGWTAVQASVVCGQLGHSHDDAVARDGAYFGRGTGDIVLDDVSCSGYEDRLIDCSHRGAGVHDCNHYEDAGVECAPRPNVTFVRTDLSGIETDIEAIRLVNGDTNYMGRVELFYNGTWGTVCDDFWSYSDAKVACSMLGYGDAVCAVTSNQFGHATSSVPFWMDNVQCSGTEEALDQCSFPGWANNNCNHATDDAGVICKSEDVGVVGVPNNIRMVESTTKSLTLSWTVPNYPTAAQNLRFSISYQSNVFPNPLSTTVYPGSGVREGDTVTHTLRSLTRNTEYTIQVRAQVQFSACSVSMFGAFSDVMTFRTSDTLRPSNYSVRLVSPYSSGADFLGRVEVLYNGQWGTVCDDYFYNSDADVVCGMAGYSDAICTTRFGRGTGPVWLDNIGCSSGDEVLEDCSRLNWGSISYFCSHFDDVGVICRPSEDDFPPVRNLAVRSVSASSITITWERYTFPRGISSSYFDVFYSYRPGSWSSFTSISGSLTQYTLNNLLFERQYNITIRPKVTYSSCRYSNILGPFSPQVNATTMESAPGGPPSQFNIEAINETSIEVLWGLPAANVRNGIIRGYKLFVQARGGEETTMNITSSNTQAFIVGGLQPATAYTVSILAYTAAGDGPRSIRLTTVTRTHDRTLITGFGINGNNLDVATRSYFSGPIRVHCIARDGSPNTTVEWFFPNGTEVRRSSNIGVQSYSNGTTVLQLGIYRGLLTYCEGGRYTCVVNTTSGRSERRTFHLKIGSSIPQPSRPTYSKRGGSFITLSWSESFCDGGHEISSFTIRYRRSSSYYYSSYSYITISNPAQRSYQVLGLSYSTSYRFGILATAIDGSSSSYTSDAYITTLPRAPSAPRNVVARLVRPLLVEVSWTRPTTSNGVITQYTVYATPFTIPLRRRKRQIPSDVIEKVFSGSATSGNITLTRHSVSYEFQVSAATMYGSSVNEGLPSTVTTNTVVFIPEPGLPKPVNVGVSGQTNASLSVSWNYPPPPIGIVITNFIVAYSGMVEWRSPGGNLIQFEDSGEAAVNSTSITLSPLIPGTNYLIKVSAITPRGRGEQISTTGAVLNSASQDSLAYFQLRLSPIINCHNYLAFSGNITEKLLSVRSAIIEELSLMCPRCRLTTANIRDDEFSCRGGLTNQIVYRAMIIGTTTSSPTDLVSLIQLWVRGGAASIRVPSSTRLYIDPDCDAILDTLWDPDCPLSSTTTPPPTTDISTTTASISTTEPDTTTAAPGTTIESSETDSGSVGGAEASVIRPGVIGGVVLAVVIVVLVAMFLVVLIVTIVKWKTSLREKSEGQIRGRSITSMSNRESAQFEFSDTDSKDEYTL